MAHNDGKSFEARVAALLLASGYEVTRDIRVGGAQIDIIATRKSDLFADTQVVECKEYTGSVGVPEASADT